MTIVVGQALDTGDRGALALGGLLARSLATDVVVCGVLQHRWTGPTPAHAAAQREAATSFLTAARALLPAGVPATDDVRLARSVPAALHDAATEHAATTLVLGSSEDGVRGRIAVGSVADRVLHSSPVPVAIAPRGFSADGSGRLLTRVTVAVDSGPSSTEVLAMGAQMAHRAGVPLRMVTFAIRRKTMFPPEMGFDIEDSVLDAWREQAEAGQRRAVAELSGRPDAAQLAPVDESAVVSGPSWEHAVADLDWQAGDVLLMGSSSESALTKVFLGSTATKLLRAATVPVIVLPRNRNPAVR
ncbi:Nucleotide-binding universal stress protein, UspA family [Sanguibacter gelidistatuariae]|uniref:Nucleotide-binding universal stress protein, UspA family n=1 Tax=Sanguibacter gelidistatuariae TaxID=1814289 RepID=A0A1G6SBL9_9MICO|nr:universal stress protein [Sanguibacter gelidistatuariae]SDD13537.1 Nucleotide-binding universal stress protein, UspA family [Sanguibacter gelidistatuariae]